MKIQCDVCGKEEATIFCTADEAALCRNCDNRVHNANKLASKHPRFSLLYPQLNESPLKKHNRFFLTGVKLSPAASSSSYQGVASSSGSQSEKEMRNSSVPGWHVDDFLDPSSHYSLCKTDDHISPHMSEEGSSFHYQMYNVMVANSEFESS